MLYDRRAAVDSAGQMSFYLFAVTTVALGADVWGLATADTGPGHGVHSPHRPSQRRISCTVSARMACIRSTRRFRAPLPGNTAALRAPGTSAVNLVTAVVGGLGVLGLWTLASRLIQVPILAFTSLYTVGFPAMSRVLAGGEDQGR